MARALVIVDFQLDRAPGGALEVPGGDAIAPRLNALAHSGHFALVVAARDWHPPDHTSFAERGGALPVHAVHDTPGAELHPALDRQGIDLVLDKGVSNASEGLSAFEDSDLADLLRAREVEEVHVAGLGLEDGVRRTALDALALGFRVVIDPEAVRATDIEDGDGARVLEELREAGAAVGG